MLSKLENIPACLKQRSNWVCCGKSDKIPKNPLTGKNAKANDPKTWGSFEQAVEACEKYGFEYVGFEFAPPFFGVDLDHCLDKTDFVDEFVETLQSYAEISRSGSGIHIICKGELPEGNRRKGDVEMYSTGRYFIITGNVYNPQYTEVVECTEPIKVLHGRYLPPSMPQHEAIPMREGLASLDDAEVVDKARGCKSGSLFTLLYSGDWQGLFPSQSEADLALCNILAFWTGRDPIQIDRIFRTSGLMRPKWDRKQGGATYGARTIEKACSDCAEVYEPSRHGDGTDLALSFFKGGKEDGKQGVRKVYDFTDTGNAHRLYDKFGEVIRYSYSRKKWYFWTGKQWVLDETGGIKKLADIICDDLKKDAYQIQDEDLQEEALKWARRTQGSAAKENMIKECQHLEDVPIALSDFDSYEGMLNCQNGIINLRNGELMPHDGKLLMSKITSCEYDVDRKPPKMWLQFLDDVTGGDKALQEYIQRSVGYSLTGSNREQCAYFLYGLGNNGKSTFLDTIADMLGDYAANIQPETIMIQGKIGSLGGGANTEIARLKSARFVTCEEPTEGIRLNEGLLKQLTGGSKITARFLYGDEFEYTPEFKIWIATNHKPSIRGTDFGIWRRIKLIPFEVNIPKEKVDKNLKYKLRQEFPQILAWAVEGCIKWLSDGSLGEPEKVEAATKDYRQEMDLIGTFADQCFIIDYEVTEKIPASDLFAIYKAWARENNEWEMSSKRFGMEMAKKTPEKSRTAKGVVYSKIRLTEYAKKLLPRQYKAEDFK